MTIEFKTIYLGQWTANLFFQPNGQSVKLIITNDETNEYFFFNYAGGLFTGGHLKVGNNVRHLRRVVDLCYSDALPLSVQEQNCMSDIVDKALSELPYSFALRNSSMYDYTNISPGENKNHE